MRAGSTKVDVPVDQSGEQSVESLGSVGGCSSACVCTPSRSVEGAVPSATASPVTWNDVNPLAPAPDVAGALTGSRPGVVSCSGSYDGARSPAVGNNYVQPSLLISLYL